MAVCWGGGGGGGGGDNLPSLSSGCPVTVAKRGGEGRHLTLGGGRRTELWSYEDGRGEGGPPPTASAGKIRAVKLAPKVYSSHKPTYIPVITGTLSMNTGNRGGHEIFRSFNFCDGYMRLIPRLPHTTYVYGMIITMI